LDEYVRRARFRVALVAAFLVAAALIYVVIQQIL
jgi:hypothetical protein